MNNYNIKTFYVNRIDDVNRENPIVVYGHYVVTNKTSFIIYKQVAEPNGYLDVAICCYPLSHYSFTSVLASKSK